MFFKIKNETTSILTYKSNQYEEVGKNVLENSKISQSIVKVVSIFKFIAFLRKKESINYMS